MERDGGERRAFSLKILSPDFFDTLYVGASAVVSHSYMLVYSIAKTDLPRYNETNFIDCGLDLASSLPTTDRSMHLKYSQGWPSKSARWRKKTWTLWADRQLLNRYG